MQLLAEDYDGQMSLYVPENGVSEPQIDGQLSIGDVLADWEKKKRAAKAVLDEAQQRKLRASKERALREVSGIMENLLKLDPGLTADMLLPEQYDGEGPGEQDMAETLASITQALDQRINTVKQESAQIDEQLAVMGAGLVSELPKLMEEIPDQPEETAVPGDGMQEVLPGDEGFEEDVMIAEQEDSVLMPVNTIQPDEEILPWRSRRWQRSVRRMSLTLRKRFSRKRQRAYRARSPGISIRRRWISRRLRSRRRTDRRPSQSFPGNRERFFHILCRSREWSASSVRR